MSTQQTLPETKSVDFNGHPVSLIERNDDFVMTMNDIGKCLDYVNPRKAVHKIYTRNKALLNQYSLVSNLGTIDGKTRLQRVLNEKGMMLIAMKSNQPKAVDFQIWAVETLSSLRNEKHPSNQSNPPPKMELRDKIGKMLKGETQLINALFNDNEGTKEEQLTKALKSEKMKRELAEKELCKLQNQLIAKSPMQQDEFEKIYRLKPFHSWKYIARYHSYRSAKNLSDNF